MTKILVIEDQPIFQNVYRAVLERHGLEVISALDGKSGLKQALKHKPNLILLDMMMPNVNGMQFLESFQPRTHPETKVIVFSNISMDEHKRAAFELGAVKYLTKAELFTPKQLLETVEELLKPTKSTSNA